MTRRSTSSRAGNASTPPHRDVRGAVILRSTVLGVASGSRSSLALGAPAVFGNGPRLVRVGAALAIVGELVGDKLPTAPSRLDSPGLEARIVTGGLGGAVLARRAHAPLLGAVAAGLAGSTAGNLAGAAWRAWAGRRVPDWVAAVVEDAVALALAAWACRSQPENLAHSSRSVA